MKEFFEFSDEVQFALENNMPLLALESTLITHGFPNPINLEIALLLEKITRDLNVTPATIAIINGKIKIGLTEDEINFLVESKNTIKASRRDISYALHNLSTAGTTVAATLFCAHLAGIKIFATGGIGGVHRGEAQDISADLIELSRIPVAVICAGAKAILDLPKTLEFLETFSVPIFGFNTDKLPAFYSTSSPYALPAIIEDIDKMANIIQTHWRLGNSSGVLIANPIPKEFEIESEKIEPFINLALHKATMMQINGKQLTPFLLNELAHITEGKSVTSNIELIKNNVKLGALLAQTYQRIQSN